MNVFVKRLPCKQIPLTQHCLKQEVPLSVQQITKAVINEWSNNLKNIPFMRVSNHWNAFVWNQIGFFLVFCVCFFPSKSVNFVCQFPRTCSRNICLNLIYFPESCCSACILESGTSSTTEETHLVLLRDKQTQISTFRVSCILIKEDVIVICREFDSIKCVGMNTTWVAVFCRHIRPGHHERKHVF